MAEQPKRGYMVLELDLPEHVDPFGPILDEVKERLGSDSERIRGIHIAINEQGLREIAEMIETERGTD